MKKEDLMKNIKKGLAVTLALAIVATSSNYAGFSVRAEEPVAENVTAEETVTEEEPATEEITAEEPATEEITDEEPAAETVSEAVVSENAVSEDTIIEETEVSANEVSENVTEETEFSESVVCGKIRITAKAEAGVLPEGTRLQVSEISTTKAIENAVENEITGDSADEIFSYDIKMMLDGEAVQPEGNVDISFANVEVEKEQKLEVVYTSDDGKKAEHMGEAGEGQSAVEITTNHFSIYNIIIVDAKNTTKSFSVLEDGKAKVTAGGFSLKDTYTIESADENLIHGYTTTEKNNLLLNLTSAAVDTDTTVEIKVVNSKKEVKAAYQVHILNRSEIDAEAFGKAFQSVYEAVKKNVKYNCDSNNPNGTTTKIFKDEAAKQGYTDLFNQVSWRYYTTGGKAYVAFTDIDLNKFNEEEIAGISQRFNVTEYNLSDGTSREVIRVVDNPNSAFATMEDKARGSVALREYVNGAWEETIVYSDYTGKTFDCVNGKNITYKVTFDNEGDKTVKTADAKFTGWKQESPAYGSYDEAKQVFTFQDGNDKLTAQYTTASVEVPEVTRQHYNFEGWFYKNEEGAEVPVTGKTFEPTADTTIYAKWSLVHFTVTFVDGADRTVKDAAYGEMVTAFDGKEVSSVSQNVVFDGWVRSTDNKLVSKEEIEKSEVTEAVTYTARYTYTTKTFTVSFISADFNSVTGAGTIYATTEVGYNGKVATPENPVMAETEDMEYTFSGWKCLETGVIYANLDDVAITSNMTLQAVFEGTAKAPVKKPKPVVTTPTTEDTTDTDEETSAPTSSGTTTATATTPAAPAAAPVVTVPVVTVPAAAPAAVRAAGITPVPATAVLGNEAAPEVNAPVTQIADEAVPLAEEPELTQISENEVPLAGPTDHCYIHWIILILSLLYALYAAVRIMARAKKIKELSGDAEEMQTKEEM